MKHLNTEQLEEGLNQIFQSPKDEGQLALIVCRPKVDQRQILLSEELDIEEGLVGDNWRVRGCSATEDGSAHPEMQLNIMNARVADLVAQSRERWPLAGDQLYVDLDLSDENFPAGTRIAIGEAIIEVTAEPHTGCKKFVERFGLDAMKFVNSGLGKRINLRGINAKVVEAGQISTGDLIRKV
ncbi:MAG: hypothetical protein P8I62_00520 [Pseudomonadales bacterium]|nr:hypothetical protein [Pseudomonadales bacterium]